MKHFIFACVILMPSVGVASELIPLNQVWAYKMPGTSSLSDLSKGEAARIDSMLWHAVMELTYERANRLDFKAPPRPGFAISGSDRSALHAAMAVLIDWNARPERLPANDDVTVVFFSEPISRYPVQIRQVQRDGKEIEIQYELVPDLNKGSHINFALIPLGKLEVGEYHVQMRQLPRKLEPAEIQLGFESPDEEWSRDFLCKPFKFMVTEKTR